MARRYVAAIGRLARVFFDGMDEPRRFVVVLSVVLGIWTVEHLYVGWRLLSLPVFGAGGGRRGLIVALVVGFLSYPLGRLLFHWGLHGAGRVLEYAGAVWMGTLFLFLFAFLAVDIVTLGGLVFRPVVMPLRIVATIVVLLGAGVAWWGGLKSPRIVHEEVRLPDLPPEADGLKIAHLSDIHLGTILGAGRLGTVIRLTDALAPDVIAIAGDLIDSDAGVVEQLVSQLQTLGAPRGVFVVLGNHEYYAGRTRARDLLHGAGYTVLDNQAVEVAPRVWVAGVPDARGSAQTGPPEADLAATLADVPGDDVVVLLQHSPEHEVEAARAGVDVMLNGHTHGGQIWPFHLMVKTAYPHIAGRYEIEGMTQLVSRGAGMWGPPMRLFAPAEIVLVTLRRAD
jgi:hypothetical protein